MPRLCLNMIVKNESSRILRALGSVVNHIDCWVICDTGSTDGTPEIITDFFRIHNIPGKIVTAPFVDFSQACNAALSAAQMTGHEFPFDYILLMDADMELKVNDKDWKEFFKDARSYDMFQCAGMLHYQNRRMVKFGEAHGYLGVTHEYLDVESGGCLPKEIAYFVDHADGSNRVDKFKRDIKLLKDGLKLEPKNARYMYYLAQSYRDCGKLEKAIDWYQRRVDAGGWDEEVWSAMLFIALCYKDLKKEAKFVHQALLAYQFRPSRAEPMWELAKYFREKDRMQEISVIFSEAGIQIPKTNDALFVNDYVYDCGLWDEFAIAAFYTQSPMRKSFGFKTTNMLALKRGPYTWSRESAQTNMIHYLPNLRELAPSWECQEIEFKAPENWCAMNPSVTSHDNGLWTIMRTVNYRMDEQGRYLIRGTADGSINNSNPINTRNWLLPLDDKLRTCGAAKEIFAPADLPCEYPLVVGFEDMRLFPWREQLWTNSTVRQIDRDGLAEQVLARIDGDQLVDVKRMLRTPRLYEKNWSALLTPHSPNPSVIKFVYRPGHVVDETGQDIVKHPNLQDIDQFAGGSQSIITPFGWIYLIHEARFFPGTQLRYYQHRFVQFDYEFKVKKVSLPFYFKEKAIEFAAGMCVHPVDNSKLVISYGFRDREARIGTVLVSDVERLLVAS